MKWLSSYRWKIRWTHLYMQDLLCNWDEYWHCTIFIWFGKFRCFHIYFQALSLVNRSPSLFIRCTQPTTRLETFSVGWFAGNIFVGRFLFWKISTVDDWFKLPANWRYAYHCQFAGNLLDDFGKFRLGSTCYFGERGIAPTRDCAHERNLSLYGVLVQYAVSRLRGGTLEIRLFHTLV